MMFDFLACWAFMIFVLLIVGVVVGLPFWALGRFCDVIGSETPLAVVLVACLLVATAVLARDFQKFRRAEQQASVLAGGCR